MPAPVIIAAGITAAGAIGGAAIASSGANKAADKQKKAAKKAAQAQKDALAQQMALAKPYVEAGKNALAEYQKLAPYEDFGMKQFQADPGYNFRMAEGLKGLERSAAARGLLQSGGTLKGIQQYGQNLASSEYENAFSRYLSQREARMDPYRYLTGVGQAAAAGQAANVGTTGAALADIAAQRGNVQAAQAAGAAGAIGNAFSSIGQGVGSYYANQPYMNYLQSITPSSSSFYNPTNIGGVY
jgi:uncharacterized protein YciI